MRRGRLIIDFSISHLYWQIVYGASVVTEFGSCKMARHLESDEASDLASLAAPELGRSITKPWSCLQYKL